MTISQLARGSRTAGSPPFLSHAVGRRDDELIARARGGDVRVTIQQVRDLKREGSRFAMLTAYDYAMAKLLDEAGVPVLLVGDSLGIVMLGYPTTLPVTVDEMIHHAKAVARGASQALLVGDMPFMSYHSSVEQAIHSAGRFLQEAGMHAVKVEGGGRIVEITGKL